MTTAKRQTLIRGVGHNAAGATTNHRGSQMQGQFGCGGVNLARKHQPGLCELQEVLICLTVNQKEH